MTSGIRVGHYLRRFPSPELVYVADQIVAARGDVVIAERGNREELLAARRQFHEAQVRRSAAAFLDRLRDRFAGRVEAAATSRFVTRSFRETPVDILHAHFGMAGAQIVDAADHCSAGLITTFYGVD